MATSPVSKLLMLIVSLLVTVATAQAQEEKLKPEFRLKALAPELSADRHTVRHAKPPLVVVADPRPERQGIRPEGLLADKALAAPERATAAFAIEYHAAGEKDLWGQSCLDFPEEAKAALQAAGAIWANTIESSVPISIRACWASFGSPFTLGYAGGDSSARDFSGAPKPSTWYSEALANSLAGVDLIPGVPDMHVTYNSKASWYFGTDGNPPAGQYDLVSVAAHQVAHGLNFGGMVTYSGGTGSFGLDGSPDIYDTFIENGNGLRFTSNPNPSTALGNLLTSNDLWFGGANASAGNGGTRPKIYAPYAWVEGASYSHLDDATFAGTLNTMMLHAIGSGSALHDPGPVTRGLLRDLGWELAVTEEYDVSGMVRDGSMTGPPLAGATVSIAGKTAVTDSSGAFAIMDVPLGSYSVVITKSGYIPNTMPSYAVNADQDGVVFFLVSVEAKPPAVTQFTVPSFSTSLTVPITAFTATDDVGVTGYLATESAVKPSPAAGGWSAFPPTSYTFTSPGRKTLYAWAKDAAGHVSDGLPATVAVTDSGLPSPWGTLDINTALHGSSSYADGTFTVTGAGANIGGTVDGFRYVYQQVEGLSGRILVRVSSQENTDPWAKAGVMIRQSLAADSPHVTVALTPANGTQISWRSTAGGSTQAKSKTYGTPRWVAIDRTGDVFGCVVYDDQFGYIGGSFARVPMSSRVYVGLAVTSHNKAALGTATFDSVKTSGFRTTAPLVTSFGVPSTWGSLTVPITTFTAMDDVGPVYYLVTESPAKPWEWGDWSSTPPTSYRFTSTGTKTLYGWARDDDLNISSSRSATVAVTGTGGWPPPWVSEDINTPLPGSASYAGGTFTLSGAGSSGPEEDTFHYVYQPIHGDGQIVARVVSQQNTDPNATAGVMFRFSPYSDRYYVSLVVTPATGAQLSWGGWGGYRRTTTVTEGIAAPYWLKLVRNGEFFNGYLSADGINWTLVSKDPIHISSEDAPPPATIYAGLAVNSHSATVASTATFDNVSVTSGADSTPPVVTAFTTPSAWSSLTVPITKLDATDEVGVTGYMISEMPGKYPAWYEEWSITKPTTYTFDSAGVKTLYASARDAAGNVSEYLSSTLNVVDGSLPSPWAARDINTALPGSASYLNGVFTLAGAGANIGGTADGFRFLYKQMTGDGEIVARVASLQNTNQWAKAGVMIRESLAADSAHFTLALTPANGAQFSWREYLATSAIGRSGIAAPYWVKLVRSGDTFTSYMSADGVDWVLISSRIGPYMSSTVYVGLVESSHNPAALGTAVFDNVH